MWYRDGRLKVMRNIDEMLNKIGENKEISEGGNNIMTREEKERILARTMEKIGKMEAESKGADDTKDRKVIKLWSGRLTKAVAATVGVALLVGGTAAATIKLNPAISNYFGISNTKQEQTAKDMTSVTEAKAKSNGVTMSVKQVLGDNTGFFAVLQAKGLKDSSDELDFRELSFKVDGVSNDKITYTTNVKMQGIDGNTTTFLVAVRYDEQNRNEADFSGKNVTLSLKDVGSYDRNLRFKLHQKGKWKLRWKLDIKEKSIVKKPDVKMTLLDSEVVWSRLKLTPMSVTVNFDVKKQGKEYFSQSEWEKYEGTDRIVVKFTDGRRIDSRFEDDINENWGSNIVMGFKEIIDMDKVESVSFNGHEIKLKENKNETLYKRFKTNANFTLDISSEVAKYIDIKEENNKTNSDIHCKQDIVTFVGNKEGIKQSLFTIYRLKTDKVDLVGSDEGDPEMKLIGQRGDYVYAIKYSEPETEKAGEVFADIMNEQIPYLLAGFEYII